MAHRASMAIASFRPSDMGIVGRSGLSFADTLSDLDAMNQFTQDTGPKVKELINLFKRRAAIELEYAKSLGRLGHSYQGTIQNYDGAYKERFTCAVDEMMGTANAHQHLAGLIEDGIIVPLNAASRADDEFDRQRRKLLNEEAKYKKELQGAYKPLKKIQTAHDKAKKESQDAAEALVLAKNNPKTKDKDLQKLLSKSEAADGRLSDVTEQLADIQEQVNQFQHDHFRVKMAGLLDAYQLHEEQRCDYLAEAYQNYALAVVQLYEIEAACADDLIDEVEGQDVYLDLDAFLTAAAGSTSGLDEVGVMTLFNPLKKGRIMMQKRKVGGSTFKPRYFVVMGAPENCMYMFDHEASTSAKMRIPIPKGDTTVRPMDPSFFDRDHTFQLTNGTGTYFFYADDATDYNEWMSALKMVSMGNPGDVDSANFCIGHVCSLKLRISEARNMKKKDDYYAMVLLDSELQARTNTQHSTNEPFWGTDFFFDEIPESTENVMILVKRGESVAIEPKGKERIAGYVEVPISDLTANAEEERWHALVDARGNNEVGQIRLQMIYTSEVIRPYAQLMPLVDALDEAPTALTLLANVVSGSDREFAARHLIQIHQGKDNLLPFISQLVAVEIESTPEPATIFRGNSLASKTIDVFMKLVGMRYLHETLDIQLLSIYESKNSCEVDPTRASGNLKNNWRHLLDHMQRIWTVIQHAIDAIPDCFRVVFADIRAQVEAKWPDHERIKYTSIAGFLFLRFFVPAILNPKLFDIVPDHPKNDTARTFTLIAKTLQNLANLVEFGAKEAYMGGMNDFILENLDQMRSLLDSVCVRPSTEVTVPLPKEPTSKLARHVTALQRLLASNLDRVEAIADPTDIPALANIRGVCDSIDSLPEPTATERTLVEPTTPTAGRSAVLNRVEGVRRGTGDSSSAGSLSFPVSSTASIGRVGGRSASAQLLSQAYDRPASPASRKGSTSSNY